MRPRKAITIIGDNADTTGRLRFVVPTIGYYRVDTENPSGVIVALSDVCTLQKACSLITKALSMKDSCGDELPVLCECPIAIFENLRQRFDVFRLHITTTRIESFENLAFMLKRKRGPRKQVQGSMSYEKYMALPLATRIKNCRAYRPAVERIV